MSARMTLTVSWTCAIQSPDLKEWRIYATTDSGRKGDLMATVAAEGRSCEIEVEEDSWTVRRVAVSKTDVEDPWESSPAVVQQLVTGRGEEPPAASEPAILQTEPGTQATVAVAPPDAQDGPTVVEVIEGPDEFTGVLVAEVAVPPAGPTRNGARMAHAAIPLDGSGGGGTRTLVVATRSRGGSRGAAATAQTVTVPERPAYEGVVVCAVDAAAGTSTNMATPSAVEGAYVAAPHGIYTKRMPALNDAAGWNDLGPINGGTDRWGSPFTPYPQELTARGSEKDLGAVLDFVLECKDQVQRLSAAGVLPTKPIWSLCGFRVAPSVNPDLKHENEEGPAWLWRQMRADGKMGRPLTKKRWQYVVGNSSNPTPSAGDWKPYVPGAWLRGRYVQVRLLVEDTLGFHGLKTGNINVYARVPIVTRQNAGTPESVVTAPPRSFCQDTTNNALYQKATGQGNTGWVQVTPDIPGKTELTAGTLDRTADMLLLWDASATAQKKVSPREILPELHIPMVSERVPSGWVDQPAAATIFNNNGSTSSGKVVKVDLTNYKQVCLRVVKLGTAAATGATLRLRYATSFNVAASGYATLGASSTEVSVAIDTTNAFLDSGWIDLVAGALGVVFIDLEGVGGDGAIDPLFGTIEAVFR